jgi:hypothetical protein
MTKPRLGKGPPKKTKYGITIATPAVKPPRLLQERIEAAVHTTYPGRFRRLKLAPVDKVFFAQVLNLMLDAHSSVHNQMIHPANGQFDGTASEAARSFVRSFAARHRIPGVDFDTAFYR